MIKVPLVSWRALAINYYGHKHNKIEELIVDGERPRDVWSRLLTQRLGFHVDPFGYGAISMYINRHWRAQYNRRKL